MSSAVAAANQAAAEWALRLHPVRIMGCVCTAQCWNRAGCVGALETMQHEGFSDRRGSTCMHICSSVVEAGGSHAWPVAQTV